MLINIICFFLFNLNSIIHTNSKEKNYTSKEAQQTKAIERIMNNNTAMVGSQQLQLHRLPQLQELRNTVMIAQGIDFDDLQQFTTNLQFTNTINNFSL